MPRFLLTNAAIVTGASCKRGSLGIDGERIAGIWHDEAPAFPGAEVIDLEGKVLMAGGIDTHVHFREPGMTHKADIGSESEAALLGGITSFIEMPNTNPATVDIGRLEDKLSLAAGKSMANYGFHIGATNSNSGQIKEYISKGYGSRFGGIKVFMGSSTGNMLVNEDDSLKDLFSIPEKPILIHSEDEGIIRRNLEEAKARYGIGIPMKMHPLIRSREACIRSTGKALDLAVRFGTKLHVLHVSTQEEVGMISEAKLLNPNITAETSANYLWFSDEDYDSLGGRLKCNPAIKTSGDRAALIEGLRTGVIDTIGSDHAPHLPSEKDKPYLECPSGLPTIGQSLSVVLTVAKNNGIPLSRIAEAFSEIPARIFGIPDRGRLEEGCKADLVAFDPEERFKVEDVPGKCGWSPYEGESLCGKVKMVWINGTLAVKDGTLCIGKGQSPAQQLIFPPTAVTSYAPGR